LAFLERNFDRSNISARALHGRQIFAARNAAIASPLVSLGVVKRRAPPRPDWSAAPLAPLFDLYAKYLLAIFRYLVYLKCKHLFSIDRLGSIAGAIGAELGESYD